tara:strand:- start:490 stop:681 length:192 start_codon:yes stop_codon:yes gene_type:complete
MLWLKNTTPITVVNIMGRAYVYVTILDRLLHNDVDFINKIVPKLLNINPKDPYIVAFLMSFTS